MNGNNIIYTYEYIVGSSNLNENLDEIEKSLKEKIKFINYINLKVDNTKLHLSFILNPDYFVNTQEYEINYSVEKSMETGDKNLINNKLQEIKNAIHNILKGKEIIFTFVKIRKNYLESKIMPENIEIFNNTYLEGEYDSEYQSNIYRSIKNENMLKSLLTERS